MVTEPQVLGIARTLVAIVATRLGRRLLRAARLTEKPRDVTFVALDIAGFGRRTSHEQAKLRQRLFSAASLLKHRLGSPLSYGVLDRGDGVLVLLAAATETLRVLRVALPAGASRISADNRANGGDKMVLRCALHKGQAQRDRWGWVGSDVNIVFRLLDSRALRIQLDQRDHRSPMTVALSEAIYHDARTGIDDEQLFENVIKSTWHDTLARRTFKTKEVEQQAWVASVGVDISTHT